MIILTVAVMGCTAEDIAIWKDADRRDAERGIECYRRASGTAYCVDKYGNRVY